MIEAIVRDDPGVETWAAGRAQRRIEFATAGEILD